LLHGHVDPQKRPRAARGFLVVGPHLGHWSYSSGEIQHCRPAERSPFCCLTPSHWGCEPRAGAIIGHFLADFFRPFVGFAPDPAGDAWPVSSGTRNYFETLGRNCCARLVLVGPAPELPVEVDETLSSGVGGAAGVRCGCAYSPADEA
jgi:hypothetical protein